MHIMSKRDWFEDALVLRLKAATDAAFAQTQRRRA
jgi:hypothetical protein